MKSLILILAVTLCLSCSKNPSESNNTPNLHPEITAAIDSMLEVRDSMETDFVPVSFSFSKIDSSNGVLPWSQDSLFHHTSFRIDFVFADGSEHRVYLDEVDIWHKSQERPVAFDTYHYCHTCVIESFYKRLPNILPEQFIVTVGGGRAVEIQVDHHTVWSRQSWVEQFDLG